MELARALHLRIARRAHSACLITPFAVDPPGVEAGQGRRVDGGRDDQACTSASYGLG